MMICCLLAARQNFICLMSFLIALSLSPQKAFTFVCWPWYWEWKMWRVNVLRLCVGEKNLLCDNFFNTVQQVHVFNWEKQGKRWKLWLLYGCFALLNVCWCSNGRVKNFQGEKQKISVCIFGDCGTRTLTTIV